MLWPSFILFNQLYFSLCYVSVMLRYVCLTFTANPSTQHPPQMLSIRYMHINAHFFIVLSSKRKMPFQWAKNPCYAMHKICQTAVLTTWLKSLHSHFDKCHSVQQWVMTFMICLYASYTTFFIIRQTSPYRTSIKIILLLNISNSSLLTSLVLNWVVTDWYS